MNAIGRSDDNPRRPGSSGNDGNQPPTPQPTSLEPALQPPLGRSAPIDIPGAKARQATVILAAEEGHTRNTVSSHPPDPISYNLGSATHHSTPPRSRTPAASLRLLHQSESLESLRLGLIGPNKFLIEDLELLGLIFSILTFSILLSGMSVILCTGELSWPRSPHSPTSNR